MLRRIPGTRPNHPASGACAGCARYVLTGLLLAAALVTSAAASPLQGSGTSGANPDELLPADEAFMLGAERQADETIVLHWSVAEDYYLYRDRSEFKLVDAGDASLGEPRFAPATEKDDPFFGQTAVYYQDASVRLPLQGEVPDDARLAITYQGCNEPLGVCYPPIEKTLALSSMAEPGAGIETSNTDQTASGSEQGRIAAALADQGLWWTALAFVGFGLLLTFTPCVLPMIPILSGLVAGRQQSAEPGQARRAAGLSVVFVLAMAITYAGVGVVVGLTGASIQPWFQQPLILGLFAGLFVLLAAAMFGLFDLQVPAGLRGAIEQRTRRLGGTVSGALALGALSAIIVGPCVTPPLIGALLYIADTGDPVTGGVALFALGLGMGVPLIAAGTAAGHWLPRSGPWMETIRQAFGILLLAVAVWLIGRVVPTPVEMTLWAVLLIVTGVQMGALSAAAAGWPRVWKGVGAVLALYGALLLVGAAGGGQSLLRPLQGVVATDSNPSAPARDFRTVDGAEGLQAALSEARRTGRPAVLDVYADWCVACKELEAFTFPAAPVQSALEGAMLLRADVTANDAGDQALLERFDLFGPPAVLFFGADGVERRGHRLVGFEGPDPFAHRIARALPGIDS
ncbi:MAG: protein-disulfide reductase DsbD [Halofilum sp. (in: g-proteobacteria)]